MHFVLFWMCVWKVGGGGGGKVCLDIQSFISPGKVVGLLEVTKSFPASGL